MKIKLIFNSIISSIILIISGCGNQQKTELKGGQIVACIGDSVTYAGGNGYVEYLQKNVNEAYPVLDLTFLNWGKNSETITGLSEAEHPFPRPYLFDRLSEEIKKQKIDVAIFNYGINCGIYGEPSEELFSMYEKGVNRFLDTMQKYDVKVVLLTPPPFALKAAKQNGWKPTSEVKYSWKNPYENYDEEVIQEFKKIILSKTHPAIIKKIDIHEPLTKNQHKCYGKDPIHPKKKGYELIGETVMAGLGF